jgi:hypothetical protein
MVRKISVLEILRLLAREGLRVRRGLYAVSVLQMIPILITRRG